MSRTNRNISQTIDMTSKFVEKVIIGCMVMCKGSTEETQRFLEHVLGIHVSIGTISQTIGRAADNARLFNESVSLENIIIGAHDEIFQAGIPVLVGVEPHSTYIFLLEGVEQRDHTTWGVSLLEKQAQGLKLEVSVNDAGSGMTKGLREAFPDLEIQSDVFHAEWKLSKAIRSLENRAYRAIGEEAREEKQCLTALINGETPDFLAYEHTVAESARQIEVYETAVILAEWIHEAFQVGGASSEERRFMLTYCLQEFTSLRWGDNGPVKRAITYLHNHQSELLSFVVRMERALTCLAEQEHLRVEVLMKMWEQHTYPTESLEYNLLEAGIGAVLQDRYLSIRNAFTRLLTRVVRASSMVECINSLLRPYLFLKRTVTKTFQALLQCYFNVREYRRSRRRERRGKSPFELLTGRKPPQLFDILIHGTWGDTPHVVMGR